MMAKTCILLALLWLSTEAALGQEITPASQPEEGFSAKQALAKMAKAMQTLNYEGTVAFLRNGKLETMKYFHAAHNGVEQERLLSLNSPLREIIRDAKQVSCLYKATNQVVVDNRPFERSFLVDLPKNLDDLDAVYNIEMVGEENIAMQIAHVVAITPKDKLRFIRKIWLSKDKFLPLKMAVTNQADDVLEELMFTDQQVTQNQEFVNVKASAADSRQNEEVAETLPVSEAGFVTTKLPDGFKEIFFTRRPMYNSNQPVDHLLLSDGLASVSIYVEPVGDKGQANPGIPQNQQSVGAVNFFSRRIGDFEFTVLGEIPLETAKLIAEGIELKPTGQ
jgi:sigma-E factor negative regulatory protein RseB